MKNDRSEDTDEELSLVEELAKKKRKTIRIEQELSSTFSLITLSLWVNTYIICITYTHQSVLSQSHTRRVRLARRHGTTFLTGALFCTPLRRFCRRLLPRVAAMRMRLYPADKSAPHLLHGCFAVVVKSIKLRVPHKPQLTVCSMSTNSAESAATSVTWLSWLMARSHAKSARAGIAATGTEAAFTTILIIGASVASLLWRELGADASNETILALAATIYALCVLRQCVHVDV